MYILRLHCDDQPGIVAAVATTLSNNQCNIEEAAQFHDHLSGQFFWRCVFSCAGESCVLSFRERFEEIAAQYSMTWSVIPCAEKVKTVIMVSQTDHCLVDLLYRWKKGNLPISVTAIVSNHETNKALAEEYDLPFHYLPIDRNNKNDQEKMLQNIVQQTDSRLIVLARYMQILSNNFCNKFSGRVINIHHSFLPGFKGAKPYHQAYERGVKIIGATAHFATADLDEGPIIEQETASIDHSHTPEKLQLMGQDIESRVLARAIRAYAEHRVFLHGGRTIIL